jgi:hypothetical protein
MSWHGISLFSSIPVSRHHNSKTGDHHFQHDLANLSTVVKMLSKPHQSQDWHSAHDHDQAHTSNILTHKPTTPIALPQRHTFFLGIACAIEIKTQRPAMDENTPTPHCGMPKT